MGGGDQTIRFYAANAETYADFAKAPNSVRLQAFLARLATGAGILELGCGNGRDSAFMLQHGFAVTPTDGVAEMAAQAEARLGVPVAVLDFAMLEEAAAYDGVWANACLLHVRRAALPDVLSRIHRALRAGGLFYASYKAGEGEGSDGLGRYYNYPTPEWLRATYEALPWAHVDIDGHRGGAYDAQPTEWLHVTAIKA